MLLFNKSKNLSSCLGKKIMFFVKCNLNIVLNFGHFIWEKNWFQTKLLIGINIVGHSTYMVTYYTYSWIMFSILHISTCNNSNYKVVYIGLYFVLNVLN